MMLFYLIIDTQIISFVANNHKMKDFALRSSEVYAQAKEEAAKNPASRTRLRSSSAKTAS